MLDFTLTKINFLYILKLLLRISIQVYCIFFNRITCKWNSFVSQTKKLLKPKQKKVCARHRFGTTEIENFPTHSQYYNKTPKFTNVKDISKFGKHITITYLKTKLLLLPRIVEIIYDFLGSPVWHCRFYRTNFVTQC